MENKMKKIFEKIIEKHWKNNISKILERYFSDNMCAFKNQVK